MRRLLSQAFRRVNYGLTCVYCSFNVVHVTAWVCVGALSILGSLDSIDRDRVGGWLCERQLPNGGLNGRPQKLEDVCYSWWVLSTLSVLGRLHWINANKLSRFILSAQVSTCSFPPRLTLSMVLIGDIGHLSHMLYAQDAEDGGIGDRPDNVTDVFHTVFGCAGK